MKTWLEQNVHPVHLIILLATIALLITIIMSLNFSHSEYLEELETCKKADDVDKCILVVNQ